MITEQQQSTLINNYLFRNRKSHSPEAMNDAEALLWTLLNPQPEDMEELADALRYYGFISDQQAIKMSKGQIWDKAGA